MTKLQFPHFFTFTTEINLVTFTREILENGKLSFLCSASFNLSMDYACTICPSIFDVLRNVVPFVQLKNVKNTHGGVLLLVTKSNTPPSGFFTFLKLYKWYQIAQRITYLQFQKFQRKMLTLAIMLEPKSKCLHNLRARGLLHLSILLS